MKDRTQLRNIHDVESLGSIITQAFYSHQTWSSFLGSFASSLGMICLQQILNNFISNAAVLQNEENARKNMNTALKEGPELLGKMHQYKDAHEVYLNAKLEFEKYFINHLKKNTFYQNSYINLIYGFAQAKLYLGDYENACMEISTCLERFPDITYRIHDLQGLLGVIHLKMNRWNEACEAFDASLQNQPNQQAIIHLKLKCFLQGANINSSYKEMTTEKAYRYLAKSMLFQTTHIDPYIFELNLAHIEALIHENSFNEALEKLNAMEKQYSTTILATEDQKRLYELFIMLISRSGENAQIIKPSDYQAKFNNPCLIPSILSSEESRKSATELYNIKLETLNVPNIKTITSKKNNEVSRTETYNPNRLFYAAVAVTVCSISYLRMNKGNQT